MKILLIDKSGKELFYFNIPNKEAPTYYYVPEYQPLGYPLTGSINLDTPLELKTKCFRLTGLRKNGVSVYHEEA